LHPTPQYGQIVSTCDCFESSQVPARRCSNSVVEAGGIAMGGPGGAPQEDSSPDERRDRDRS
jgi:hypothetical protein